MAQEIGVAYVTVAPSAKGFGKAVEGEIDKGVSGASKSAGGRLKSLAGSVVKWGTAAVAGVGAAITGIALGGGIARAMNIEDAQAKLRGLGHDARSVESIMVDALASVKGTSFGLDTAATVAATAVAAGIKPGQELEKYLRLTADAATIAGVSMEEMGSILNKATTAGKVYTQELNQLADRGLPSFQWLQDEYGVTAEELRKMVAAGQVDAATFRKVIEENIGGAALSAGDTTRGAFANMRAAMSRFGEALLGAGGLGYVKTFFQEVTVIFDGLTDRVKPYVKRFQDQFGDMFDTTGMGERFLAGLDRIVDGLASGPIPQLIAALAPVLPALAEMASVIGKSLGEAFRELGAALEPVIPLLGETLANAVVQLAPPLTDLLVALIPLIPSLVELLAVVVPLAAGLLELLIPALVWLVENGIQPTFDALNLLISAMKGDIGFADFIEGAQGLGGIFEWLIPIAIDMGTKIGEMLLGVHRAFEAARLFVTKALTAIGNFFRTTWETIGLVLGGAFKVITGLVTGNMSKVRDGIGQALNAISSWWSNVWNGMASLIGGVWSAVTSRVSAGINGVIGFIQSLVTRVRTTIAVLPGMLVSIGQQMIQGLINGVSSMINNAVAAVRNVGGAMLDSIKSFLGIHSPSRVFRDEVGKMVGLGLLEGVGDAGIRSRIDHEVSGLVEVPSVSSAASGSGPAVFNLYDADGALLGSLRGMVVDAFSGGSDGRLVSAMGGRRL